MNTSILQNNGLNQLTRTNYQTSFNAQNPLLRYKEQNDEFELEQHLDTKEGQVAFLKYHIEKAKGSQGFIARGFNKLKGLTGIGLSSKKLDAELNDFVNGKVPFEKICEDINKFKYNQKEATEIFIDTATTLIPFAFASVGNKFGTLISSTNKMGGFGLNYLFKASSWMTATIMKPITKFIDSFGIEKSQRKENRHFFKDLLTGGINASSGIVLANSLGKGYGKFITTSVAAYGVNSAARYLTLPKEEKSFEDFCRQQIENPLLKLAALAGFTTLGLVNCNKAKKMQEAAVAIVNNKPTEIGLENANSQIQDIAFHAKLFENNEIKSILGQRVIPPSCVKNSQISDVVSYKMQELEKYNIFLPKFLQTLSDDKDELLKEIGESLPEDIKNDGELLNDICEIVRRFKSNCTGERTCEEAQETINAIFGDKKYEIVPKDDYMSSDKKDIKPLGVGSVAETWKVKDSNGHYYAIKLIKKGISCDKMDNDKSNMMKLIENEADKKSLETLYEVWKSELNLEEEMKNGEILGRSLQKASVAKGIEVKSSKDGIVGYVMELAPGVQLSEYLEYYNIRKEMGCNKKDDPISSFIDSEKIKLKYMELVYEQLLSVPKSGDKVMHADPHAGNVFIDIKNGQPHFTFIDTGNVVKFNSKEAVKNTIEHLHYFLGNTDAIARIHLENAIVPNGQDKKELMNELSKHLYEKFYQNNCLKKKNKMDIFTHIDNIVANWMQEKGITPDPKLSNLHKAEATYFANSKLMDMWRGETINERLLTKEIRDKTISNLTEDEKNKISEYFLEKLKKSNKTLDKIDSLINENSKNQSLKIEYFEQVSNELLYNATCLSLFCDDASSNLLEQYKEKVCQIGEKLIKYIQGNFGGNDNDSNRYRAHIDLLQCRIDIIKSLDIEKIYGLYYDYESADKVKQNKTVQDLLRIQIGNGNDIFKNIDRVTDKEKIDNLNKKSMSYQQLDEQFKKTAKEEDSVITQVYSGAKDYAKAYTDSLATNVKIMAKTMLQHPLISKKDFNEINTFINKEPERAMRGLQATLGKDNIF